MFLFIFIILFVYCNKIYFKNCDLHVYRLSNGIDVILVSNPSFLNSACIISIEAGYIYEPQAIPGLAHFAEHMIFQGSKNFPMQNQIRSYFSLYSGTVNGITTAEQINCYFTIDNYFLKGALEIFADAITQPLLSPVQYENEIKIVDYEYKKNLNNEFFKYCAMVQNSLHPNIPEHHLSCGNKKTLTHPNLENELKMFVEKLFTADRTRIAIASNKLFDELIALVKPFEQIRKSYNQNDINLNNKDIQNDINLNNKDIQNDIDLNNKETNNISDLKPDIQLSDKYKGAMVKYETNVPNNTLSIIIQLPTLLEYYLYKPFEYIHLEFNKEGEKSLRSLLKGEKLVTDFYFQYLISKRITKLTFNLMLVSPTKRSISKVINLIHTFINTFEPNEIGYMTLEKQFKIKEYTTAYELLNVLIQIPSIFTDIKKYMQFYKYNEHVITQILEKIGDLSTWMVLKASKNIPNAQLLPFTFVRHSLPKKIKLKNSNVRLKQNNKAYNMQNDIEKVQLVKTGYLFNNQTQNLSNSNNNKKDSKYTPVVIYKEHSNGEYIIITNECIKPKHCSVTIILEIECDSIKIIDMLLICNILKFRYNQIPIKFNLNKLEFQVTGQTNNVIKAIHGLASELSSFSVNSDSLSNAYKEVKQNLKAACKKQPYYRLIDSFIRKLQGCPEIESIAKYINRYNYNVLKMPTVYYTTIIAVGELHEEQVISIFKRVNSKISTVQKCKTRTAIENYRFRTKTTDNTLLLAFPISSHVKNGYFFEYAIAQVLQPILTKHFYDFIRLNYPVSYLNDFISVQFCHKFYLCFLIQSNKKTREIRKIVNIFTSTIKEMISRIPENEFELIKYAVERKKALSGNSIDELNAIANLMLKCKCFDYDIVNLNSKFILSLTKQQILDADVFKQLPCSICFIKSNY